MIYMNSYPIALDLAKELARKDVDYEDRDLTICRVYVPPRGKRDPSTPSHWPCRACRGSRNQKDSRHTRSPGGCRWSHIPHVDWICPGCAKHKTASHQLHTFKEGECMHHSFKESTARRERQGRHPRDPAIPASVDPTVDPRSGLEGALTNT